MKDVLPPRQVASGGLPPLPLPVHWGWFPLRRAIISMCDGPFGSDMKSIHYSDEGVRLIRLQNIGVGEFRDEDKTYIPESHFRSLPGHDVEPGDLLVAGLGDESHPVGRACVFPHHLARGMVKADCFRLRLAPALLRHDYVALFLSSLVARGLVAAQIRGATRERINLSGIAQIEVPYPPPREQLAIVAYLGRKTVEIEAVLAAKQRMMGLLHEKRQALISRAVTRGLDATVPMRDSTVGWLGQVPAHWRMVPLKQLSRIQTGVTLGKSYTEPTRLYPYLRVANVQDGAFNLGEITEIAVPLAEAARSTLKPGDVLMTEGGDLDKLGRGSVWRGEIDNCLHQNHVFAVRPSRGLLQAEFLAYLTRSSHGREYFTLTGQRTTNLASTNVTKVGAFPIPLPPLPEQQAICRYIDRESSRLDRLIALNRDQIAKLREYRQTLISAAVTGQIDIPQEGRR